MDIGWSDPERVNLPPPIPPPEHAPGLEAPETYVMRPRPQAWIHIVLGGICAAMGVVFIVVAIDQFVSGVDSVGKNAYIAVGGAGFAVLGGWLAWAGSRMQVVVGDGMVTIYDARVPMTRRVPIDDADAFIIGRGPNGGSIIWLQRRDAKAVRVPCGTAGATQARQLSELNAALTVHRGSDDSTE